MSARILGIGFGSFILILLWSASVFTLLTTRKSRSGSVVLIGPISLMAAFVVTMILISLPRQSVPPDHKDLPFGDHPSPDFGNEMGHHHHQHSHDPDHDMSTSRKEMPPELQTDWMHVWRMGILILNSISLIIALVAIYIKFVNECRPRARMSTLISNTRTLKLD